ncbi:MAG: hypothetical protein JSV78_12120 [Phycisphaerales bacterium]|nr:MAG: hypothetical protein JSV78_12120 [Phycisphaerales bacterium]
MSDISALTLKRIAPAISEEDDGAVVAQVCARPAAVIELMPARCWAVVLLGVIMPPANPGASGWALPI